MLRYACNGMVGQRNQYQGVEGRRSRPSTPISPLGTAPFRRPQAGGISPAHLTACDDDIATIPVLPVPAPLAGCNGAATVCVDDTPSQRAVRQYCRYR